MLLLLLLVLLLLLLRCAARRSLFAVFLSPFVVACQCLVVCLAELFSSCLSLTLCLWHAMLLVARLYVSNLQLVVRLFLYHKLASLFPLPGDRAKLACSPSFFMSLRISTLSHDAAIVAIVAMWQLCCCCSYYCCCYCCRVLLLC